MKRMQDTRDLICLGIFTYSYIEPVSDTVHGRKQTEKFDIFRGLMMMQLLLPFLSLYYRILMVPCRKLQAHNFKYWYGYCLTGCNSSINTVYILSQICGWCKWPPHYQCPVLIVRTDCWWSIPGQRPSMVPPVLSWLDLYLCFLTRINMAPAWHQEVWSSGLV